MSNNYRMSYFMPPIAPIKDKQGRLMTPPTLIPFCEVSIEQVFQMITCNENLKTLQNGLKKKVTGCPHPCTWGRTPYSHWKE